MFVVDASASIAWCFRDERNAASDALLRRCQDEGFTVPELWFLECSNTLLIAERRSRVTVLGLHESLSFLSLLSPAVDAETPSRAFGAILNLARDFKLTIYDATYLELAVRLRIPLASRDEELKRAAPKAGVALLEA